MGYMKHHAIVVSSYDNKLLTKAHAKANEIFENKLISNIVDGIINDYQSFFVAPDGSKEGWDESDEHDKKRTKLIEWIDLQAFEDKSNAIDYSELFLGEDNGHSKVERHN